MEYGLLLRLILLAILVLLAWIFGGGRDDYQDK